MSNSKKSRKKSTSKKSVKNKKRSSSSSSLSASSSLSSIVTANKKAVYLNIENDETETEKKHGSSYVPKLSLDQFSRTEQITSSSSGSLITPNTKERIIATNKKNGFNSVKDYTKSSPSSSTTTTSSTPSTPPSKHRRRHENSNNNNYNNNNNNNNTMDNIGSVSSASSSSSTLISKSTIGIENSKDIYEKFNNGLIRLNTLEFDDVNFCFICDTTTESIQPNPCIEKTALTLTDSGGGIIIYKQIFCCDDCYVKIQTKKSETTNYNVIITQRALHYFQSIKKAPSENGGGDGGGDVGDNTTNKK